jgi:hypothetical protein
VDLVAVRQHLRGAHVGDLQPRTAIGRRRLLDRAGERGQAHHAAECAETAEESPSGHRYLQLRQRSTETTVTDFGSSFSESLPACPSR